MKGGTVPSVVTFYEITAEGIDKIEGGSEFQPPERYPGINISATGSSVITLGDGNLVNVKYEQLHSELNALKEAIADSESLNDAEKLDVTVDIETLKDQLAKPAPDPTVVQQLWSGIEKAAVVAGLAEFAMRLGPMIEQLMP